jgi:selenocysteine-specific elongation factor
VLQGTVLAEAPLVRVSARTGAGLTDLQSALSACLAERPPRPDLNRPRLAVDRVFSLPGFGTIVTGTLLDGRCSLGNEIEVLPRGVRGRVRGLQTHKRKEETAVPGSRTAVNISGVDLDEIQRGDVVARPGDYRPTRRLDAQIRLLPEVSQPLTHNLQVKLFVGASEVVTRLRLLGVEELKPGESGWVQLEPVTPVVAVRGDRYILRRPSPGETLGGGVVVDPHPKGRHRRFSQPVLERLEALQHGSPEEVLLQAILGLAAAPAREAVERSNLAPETAQPALEALLRSGR